MLLVVGTVFLYSAVHTHDFINYGDDLYVYKNTNGAPLKYFTWANWRKRRDGWLFSQSLPCSRL
jgi:hypothetical protein